MPERRAASAATPPVFILNASRRRPPSAYLFTQAVRFFLVNGYPPARGIGDAGIILVNSYCIMEGKIVTSLAALEETRAPGAGKTVVLLGCLAALPEAPFGPAGERARGVDPRPGPAWPGERDTRLFPPRRRLRQLRPGDRHGSRRTRGAVPGPGARRYPQARLRLSLLRDRPLRRPGAPVRHGRGSPTRTSRSSRDRSASWS